MADNYLERHYDDYLRRKAAWEKSQRNGKLHTHRTPPDKPEDEAL